VYICIYIKEEEEKERTVG